MKTISMLTLLHLLVDGLCACCVFMWMPLTGRGISLTLIVLYNVLAFMTQPLVGLWVDRTDRRNKVLIASVLLLLCGACLTATLTNALSPTNSLPLHDTVGAIASMTLIGMGNALFHVYGGKQVAVISHNDMRHLGIFVSTGAVGLIVGEQFSSVPVLALLAAILILLAWGVLRQPSTETSASTSPHIIPLTSDLSHNVGGGRSVSKGSLSFLIFLIFLVFIRSFVGRMTQANDMDVSLFAILAGVFAFAGKSLGGFLGTSFGPLRTLTVTLMLSGLFFLGQLLPNVGGMLTPAMILCINLTMPITLHLANRCLPGREGLAFGLLAAILAPGFALGTIFAKDPVANLLLYTLIATIVIEAAVLLAIREHRWQVLGMSIIMNIVTNLPLNALILSLPHLRAYPIQIGLECIVVLIETGLYYLVLHDGRKAFTYAFLCNTVSYLIGLLFTLLI